MFRTSIVLFLVTVLSACASVPLSTMYKLYRLSPMEADPSQLKIAIRTHKNIGIPHQGAKIQLGYESEDKSTIIDDTYFIQIISNAVLTPELTEDQKVDESVTILQLSPEDAERMKWVQQQVKQDETNDIKGKGFLSITLDNTCVTKRPVPESDLTADIFMQTSNQDGFFIFTQDLDLLEAREGWNANVNQWADCKS